MPKALKKITVKSRCPSPPARSKLPQENRGWNGIATQTVPDAKCNWWAAFGHFVLLQRELKHLLSVVSEKNSQNCKSKTKPLACCAERLKRKWEFSFLRWGNPPKPTAHTETCMTKIEERKSSSSTVWGDHCWLTSAWFVHLTPPAHTAQLQFWSG